MRTLAWFFVLLLVTSTAAFAQQQPPVVSSITPSSGPAAGGTVVTVKGSGFAACPICSPPFLPTVFFGSVAAKTTLVDAETLQAVTPAHPPQTVTVIVNQFNGRVTVPNAFTYTGDINDAFEPILLPVFSPPIHGAFGSEFQTLATAANRVGIEPIFVFGVDQSCFAPPPLGPLPFGDFVIVDANDFSAGLTTCSSGPGRLLYVDKAHASAVTFNLRVRDLSRNAESHGTEIPIVRRSDFTTERISLLNVPIEDGFRNTLRIYALAPTSAVVTVLGQRQTIALQPGANAFEPAFAQFSNFPTPAEAGFFGDIRVDVEQPFGAVGVPIWAFITVTNNQTQEITTITPD
ncbi:MAG TPA: IPT/TIG domain-containing protein [Thermoanaerobaculia bacterium]